MALAKKYRLPLRAGQPNLARRGKLVVGSFFVIRYLPNGLPYGRLGVIIPKRVSKKSTLRHYWRRLLVETGKEPIIQSGIDWMVIVSPTIVGKSKKEINSQWQGAIKKIIVK